MPARHAPRAFIGQHTPLHITATGTLVPVGLCVNTTSATTITGGGVSQAVAVSAADAAKIAVGMQLNIANGAGGAAETVTVQSVDRVGNTFTATFANGHSGAYTITSLRGTFLGAVVINKVGTGDTITLFNGSPNTLPHAGAAFAVITPVAGKTYRYDCACDFGLFYTVAATAAGDYSMTFLDMPSAA